MDKPLGIIPAIRKMKDFEKGLESDSEWIIILESRLAQLTHLVTYCKRANKKALIHFDLIKGLKSDEFGLEYIVQHVKPHGILSTRGNIIELAKRQKMLAIQRVFLLDSLALEQNIKQIERSKPDLIEVLPGLIPGVIQDIQSITDIPVIAGGLVKSKDEINHALEAGAIGVSTSDVELWFR